MFVGRFLNLIKKFLKYNFHLALAAAIAINIPIYTIANYAISTIILLNAIAFFSTLASYNYYRRNSRPTWLIPLVLTGIFYLLLGIDSMLLLTLNIVICLIYQSPIKWLNMRRNAIAKPLLISICWINTIFLLPLLVNINEAPLYLPESLIPALYCNQLLLFLALCLVTDLTQVKLDKIKGLQSYPVKYGIRTTQYTILLLGCSQLMLAWVYYHHFSNPKMAIFQAIQFLGLTVLVSITRTNALQKTTAILADIFIGLVGILFFLMQ